MELATTLIDSDLVRQFADWGQAVTHQTVAAVFDPETLVNDETTIETELTAIVSVTRAEPTPNTGGHNRDPQLRFTFRTADLPVINPAELRRIAYQNGVYDLIAFDVHAAGRVTILHCRRR